MTEATNITDLKQIAVSELDQMDQAFALIKTFGETFDGYMKKLQGLVIGLLDAEFEDEFFGLQNTVKIAKQPLARKDQSDKFKRGTSLERNELVFENYRAGLFSLQREQPIDYNSVNTGNFNSVNWHPDQIKKEYNVGSKSDGLREDNLFSALQVQTQTINKIIDAGEVNSKNLREIIEKVYQSKEMNNDTHLLNEKIQNLKKK